MFFAQNKSGKVTLVIDIGSSSIGAALVSSSKGVAPKILWSTRLPIALQNETEKGRSLAAVVQALESVVKTAADQHIVVHSSHIFFSSPWYTSKTSILKIENDSPVLITNHIIEKLIKEAERKNIEETTSKDEVVEHRIIRTRLNGYNTSDPYNKKAKSVEVAFYVSKVDKEVLKSVLRIVGKYFHIKNNEVSSFPLVAFSTISGILSTEQDFLVVDVRGEVTDLSLVTEGALIKSLSFPQGKNALVRAVAAGSGQSETAALSAINVVSHGNSEPTAQADVMRFAETFKQVWLQDYTKALQEMSVPPTIFLMTDPEIETFFEKALNEIKKDGHLHLLKHLNLRSFVEASSVPTDPFLALESIFVTMI